LPLSSGTANVANHLNDMGSNFLHEDKNVPPNEAEERDAPNCPNCGQQMWLMRIDTQLSDRGTQSERQYECMACGAKTTEHVAADLISPPSS
jgi:ribosomal protein L37AE/L43A